EAVGERRHAVPAQLQVVVQPAADRMRVRIDESGDYRAAVQVDAPTLIAANLGIAAGRQDAPVLDGERLHHRAALVLRGDTAVEEDQVGIFRTHGRRRRQRTCSVAPTRKIRKNTPMIGWASGSSGLARNGAPAGSRVSVSTVAGMKCRKRPSE